MFAQPTLRTCRAAVLLTAMCGVTATARAQDSASTARGRDLLPLPLTASGKLARYADHLVAPRVFVNTGIATSLAQWHHSPREWGSGIGAFGHRYAAGYAAGLVRNTTELGFDLLLHQDPRYARSPRSGFSARSVDVLRGTVLVRTDDGGVAPAWSRAFAAIATGFAVNSWQPRRLHSPRHALVLSLGGLTSYATANFTAEFQPDVKRYVRAHLGLDPEP